MRKILVLAVAAILFGAGPAFAQGRPAPPAKPATSAPNAQPETKAAGPDTQTSTATYGDWILRCQQGGTPPRRLCEVAQNVFAKGQSQPFAQVAFGRVEPKDPLSLTVLVPNNVSFAAPAKFGQEGAEAPSVTLVWTRCLPGGCFATTVPTEDAFKRWRAAAQAGRVTFQNGTGQEVAMIISLRGLAQAMDALAKEVR